MSNQAEKRSVATDALETLGMVIDEGARRDAIHLAVEPTIAAKRLFPGQDVGIDGTTVNPVGIVDPFLTRAVEPGERFWLVVYPRQITSLRHVWTHPAFDDAPTVSSASDDPVSVSERWIEDFAKDIDQTVSRLMSAAEEWLEYGEYTYDNGESYKEHWDRFPEFWQHYEVVTGKAPAASDRHSFFTCSC